MATAAVRRISARIAAHTRWSKEDRVEGTRPAREAFIARFEREVDPDVLDPEERRRRAESAMSAYFSALALKSVKARSARAT